MSTTAPHATVKRARVMDAQQLGRHDHYLTDSGRDRIILGVLATRLDTV